MFKKFYLTLDWTITGTTTPAQSGPGSNDNERVLHISQSFRMRASSSDSLLLYPGYLLGGVPDPSAEMQLVYSTALPD